jgi:hypothetical protein
MTVFDLLFCVVLLIAIGLLAAAGIAAARRRWARALKTLGFLGIFAGVYLGIVIIVSLLSPRQALKMGERQCWDEWCMGVADVERKVIGSGLRYIVTVRISSRARQRPQRGRGAYVYVLDESGRRYDPVPDDHAIPFDALLQPGKAIDIVRVFELPADAREPVLAVSHGGGFPGWCIIGDAASLFHKPIVVRLD